jgi:hypothetical protein
MAGPRNPFSPLRENVDPLGEAARPMGPLSPGFAAASAFEVNKSELVFAYILYTQNQSAFSSATLDHICS